MTEQLNCTEHYIKSFPVILPTTDIQFKIFFPFCWVKENSLTFTDPAVTELACSSGLDFVWLDGEHGEFGRETAMLHMMAVKGTGVASLYREIGRAHV